MTSKQEKAKHGESRKPIYKQWWFWVSAASVFLVAIVVASVVNRPEMHKKETKPTESSEEGYKLTDAEQSAFSSLYNAALRGVAYGISGITVTDCESIRKMALNFDSKADWFDDDTCGDNSVIEDINYSETSKTIDIILTDNGHAATYTFSSDQKYLLDFQFERAAQIDQGEGRMLVIQDKEQSSD